DGFSQVVGAIVGAGGSSTPIRLDGRDSSGVSALSDGKLVVASANGTGVLAQIYNSDGTLSGSEQHLNQPGQSATVAKPANGGFVLVWADNYRIAEQVFDATGKAVGQQFTTASSDPLYTRNSSPAVAALPGGGFIVVWANTQT